jgi:heptosyltransferase-2
LRNALPPRGRSESRPLNESAPSPAAADTAHASPDRVLVVAPSWVGDAVLSEPLIARLRARGVETIDVIASPWCAAVYRRVRGVRHVIDSPAGHGEFAFGARRALGLALRSERYTHAYVLPNSWKSALVPWFARIPRRIGYRGEARFALLTDARRLARRVTPQLVAHYAALADPRTNSARRRGGDESATNAAAPALPSPVLIPDAGNLRAAQQALGLAHDHRVAIFCPGAEFGPAKRWPVEHFAALGVRLLDDGYAIWIVGSPNDAPIGGALADMLDAGSRVIDLCGRTDLGTAIDLMSQATLVVSNDSGLMHAAAAVRAPLVALFGSSSPLYTPPLSQTARVARIEIECSPCFKRECPLGHFRCMRDLSPQLVYNLARAASSAGSAPR